MVSAWVVTQTTVRVLHDEGCDLDNEPDWFQHLTQGRVAESVWEQASEAQTGTLCGW